MFFDPPVRNLAHRGGSLLAPEETLAAFAAAADIGVDALELDVHLSADGELVVFHDALVDRTTDGSGPLREMTLEELRELNAGYRFRDRTGAFPYRDDPVRIPRLAEVMEAHAGRRIVVEMKRPETAGPLCGLIRSFGRESSTLVAAFPRSALDDFRQGCPGVATGAGFSEAAWFMALSLLRLEGLFSAPADALLVSERTGPLTVVSQRFLDAARRVGLPVIVWTVNDPEEMRRLLEFGVDGILTDDPAALAEILRQEP